MRTFESALGESLSRERLSALVSGGFALSGLLLASLGLYGLLAFLVAERAREIGIRIALGARGGDVVRMVLGQGLRLTLWGVLAGLVGALPLSRVLRSLLFGATFFDPLTFVTISALLLLTAAMACGVGTTGPRRPPIIPPPARPCPGRRA